jgi:hypothetical protein
MKEQFVKVVKKIGTYLFAAVSFIVWHVIDFAFPDGDHDPSTDFPS